MMSLIETEKLLGEDELVTLWENAVGVKSETANMDFKSFLKFNDALDDLFELDDDGVAEEPTSEESVSNEEEEASSSVKAPLPVIQEEDLPPGVLFSMIANENYLVAREDLNRWGELNDMLEGGDLTMAELDNLFELTPKAQGTKDLLDEDGFSELLARIEELFEDEEDEIKPDSNEERELKDELLDLIETLAKLSDDEGLLKCGLDCSELEKERVLEVVGELELEPYNEVVILDESGDGAVDKEQLTGDWELIYSSSSTMKYNEGLSGLAGGLTKFASLQQSLSATKFLSDVEYTEQLIGKLGGGETEVKITGDWDLRTEVSLFTNKPSIVMSVTPDRVSYGPRNDKADHWKSLGIMNLLLLSYLDNDLRIMRGNTSTDTLFIWRKVEKSLQ